MRDCFLIFNPKNLVYMLEQVWQYIIGPIVAEAINQPATWNGVEAVAGYNMFNTVLWALLAVSMILTVKNLFAQKEIKLQPGHALQVFPIILMGGLLRFVQDSINLNFYIELMLITPVIYIWMGSLAALFIYLNTEKNYTKQLYLLTGVIAVLVLYYLPPMQLIPLIGVIGLTLVVAAVYYYVVEDTVYNSLPLVLAVASQFFEAFSSMYAVTQGFETRQVLTSLFVGSFGPAGFLILKLLILAACLHAYFDLEEEWQALLLIALYSIGFATGLRVLLRAVTGV